MEHSGESHFSPWEPQDARGRRRRRVSQCRFVRLFPSQSGGRKIHTRFFGFNLFLSDRPASADCWLYYITVRKRKRVWEREKRVAHGGTIKNKNDRGMRKGSFCCLQCSRGSTTSVSFCSRATLASLKFNLRCHSSTRRLRKSSVKVWRGVGVPAVRCWPLLALIPRVAAAVHSLAAISPLPSPAVRPLILLILSATDT